LSMKPIWFKNHTAYTIAKYGMSMCVLGMSAELKDNGVAVNALWPRTAIYTAAMEMLGGGDEVAKQCRNVDIMADAAYAVLTREATGNFYIDDTVLSEEGVTDFEQYAIAPGNPLILDFFLEDSDVTFQEQVEQHKAAAAPSSGGAVAKIFGDIKDSTNDKIVGDVKGVFKFIVDDDVWYVDLKNGSGDVHKNQMDHDVTMTMKENDFVDLFTGKLNSTAAFMQGKLKIDGNMMLAMKLEKLMNQMNQNKSKSKL